jgi:hypothetical protein
MSTAKPCDFAHVLVNGRDASVQPECAPRKPGDWSDEEMAEFAAKEFEPWDPNDCPLPTNEQWVEGVRTHLFYLRLAFAAMCKTKAELIMMVRDMERDGLFRPLLDAISDTEKVMEGQSKLASAAWARLMNAAMNLTDADVQKEGGR